MFILPKCKMYLNKHVVCYDYMLSVSVLNQKLSLLMLTFSLGKLRGRPRIGLISINYSKDANCGVQLDAS